jgi:hypothetical protein
MSAACFAWFQETHTLRNPEAIVQINSCWSRVFFPWSRFLQWINPRTKHIALNPWMKCCKTDLLEIPSLFQNEVGRLFCKLFCNYLICLKSTSFQLLAEFPSWSFLLVLFLLFLLRSFHWVLDWKFLNKHQFEQELIRADRGFKEYSAATTFNSNYSQSLIIRDLTRMGAPHARLDSCTAKRCTTWHAMRAQRKSRRTWTLDAQCATSRFSP